MIKTKWSLAVLLFPIFLSFLPQSSAQSSQPILANEGASRYFGGDRFTPVSVSADGSGNIYVLAFQAVYKQIGGDTVSAFVYKLNPQFEIVYSISIGTSGLTLPRAMAVDTAGNVYVTGDAGSNSFPLVHPIQTKRGNLFLTKLDPQGNIVFSTYFGGSGEEYAQALAVDQQGNAYIAGFTNSTDFPFTASARASANPPSDWTMFALKIGTDPASLGYATSLGDANTRHNDGFLSITPVAGGGAYFLQALSKTEYPVTDGSFPDISGFGQILGRLNADGSEVVFATYIGDFEHHFDEFALDPNGNLILSGPTEFVRWDTATNQEIERTEKLSVPGTFFAVDPQGNAIVAGKNAPLTNAVAEYNGISSQNVFRVTMPSGSADLAVAAGPNGEIYALGSSGLVSRVIPGAGDANLPRIMGIGNAAALEISPKIAPGEVISLYGPNIGSAQPATTQLDPDGRVSTTLAGVQVRFNGTPGSLLYTGPQQINAVAPFDLGSGESVLVEVLHDGKTWASIGMLPVDLDPGVFPAAVRYTGYSGNDIVVSAALNEDGSINSFTNKATPGSIVTIFVTGAGKMTGGAYQDGEIFDPATPLADLPKPEQGVEMSNGGSALEVLYYGQAPEALAGVIQINFRLPATPVYQATYPQDTYLKIPPGAGFPTFPPVGGTPITVGIWVESKPGQ